MKRLAADSYEAMMALPHGSIWQDTDCECLFRLRGKSRFSENYREVEFVFVCEACKNNTVFAEQYRRRVGWTDGFPWKRIAVPDDPLLAELIGTFKGG